MPTPPSDYRTIMLTQGQVALVDVADFDQLSKYKWFAQWSPDTRSFYACRRERINGKRVHFSMHREILGLAAGDPRKGDHIEPAHTLDNRRRNLRIATNQESAWNTRRKRNNTSGFKCVTFQAGKWCGRIGFKGARISCGAYDTPEEAFAAVSHKIKELRGEFARLC